MTERGAPVNSRQESRLRTGLGIRPLLLALILGAVLLTATAVSADFSLAHWQFFKPVVLPASLSTGDLVELTLDREVFRDSAVGQGDLRLIREGNEEVAYQLVLAEGREERESVPVNLRDLGYQPGGYTSFVVDVGEDARLHNELEISTTGKNFRRQTVIEVSEDSKTWLVVQEGREIYDFTVQEQNFTARDTHIAYPRSGARYLRVRIINGEEEPLEVTGARVSLREYQPPVEMAYSPAVISRTEDSDTQTSLLILDLGSRGIPTHRLSWQTSAVNFHRNVDIEGSNDMENWQRRGGAAVYSYDTPRFVGHRLEVDFPESFNRYYRLRIQNRDNPPLALESISLFGVERKVIFKARPEGDYTLYYGNPEAPRPSYDLERVLPYFGTAGLPVATLGPHQVNPAFTPPNPPELPLTERLPWLMPVGVALASLVVAALLYGVVRQARKVLPPPNEESTT